MWIAYALELFFWAILVLFTYVALRYGGKPERVGWAIIFIGSIASALIVSDSTHRFRHTEYWMMFADSAILVALLLQTARSRRFWPEWVSSFQAITVMTHFANFFAPATLPTAYSIMQGFWVYPMMISIMLGAYGHQRSRTMS